MTVLYPMKNGRKNILISSLKAAFYFAVLVLLGDKQQGRNCEVWLTKIKRNGYFK